MHVCKYGEFHCGHFGVGSLCRFCKKNYELEFLQRENEVQAQAAKNRRQSDAMFAEAVGTLVVEHPVATLGGLLGALGLGIALSNHKETKAKSAKKSRK